MLLKTILLLKLKKEMFQILHFLTEHTKQSLTELAQLYTTVKLQFVSASSYSCRLCIKLKQVTQVSTAKTPLDQ